MATAHHTLQDWGIDESAHPVLSRFFTPVEQQRLIEDDLSAGNSVSLELIAIVALGLLIGAIAVLTTI
jgi:hypothetical protein